ncbi:hypothetical protein H9L13_04105 [Sphingomonas lutea]|uniref:Uncharacterized protein n=1 Tax=Sphingomonas lutea TaxID=1045317 RepID=A0A7G9SJQ8_9SPHN|nr:hypothetical protein [Sphingomonas lutea]QNN68083.1 hypothetical protein H9L13_04105 [Sphingomonas lutea]
MLHLVPDFAPQPRPEPYAEAVSRLASIRHALRLVDNHAGGPAPDLDQDAKIAAVWDEAGPAKQRCFDARSSRIVGATAAGVEALLVEREAGRMPHAEASRELVDQIRRELAEVARVVLA